MKRFFSKDFSVNKKHKGMKKNIPGTDFEVYSERLATLNGHYFNDKLKKNEQKRFQVVNESMQMK